MSKPDKLDSIKKTLEKMVNRYPYMKLLYQDKLVELEHMIEEIHCIGYELGYDEGYSDGYEVGHKDGEDCV